MLDWLLDVFSTQGFMPHGHCYLWTPGLLWLQVLTNAAIALAYLSISATLGWLVYRIRDIPFKLVYVAFGVFIVTCGLTHLSDVWVIWYPDYWMDGGIRLVTAIASVGTAILLPPLIPRAESIARCAKAARDRGIALEGMVQDLERMYAQATELDELKTQLFANVSHELRTPITLILGTLQRLSERAGLSDDERRDVEIAHRNTRLLLQHVEELLEVARVEAGELELQYANADMSGLVRATIAQFEGTAREQGLTITVDAPPNLPAQFDPQRLRRVVQNLLSNAVKFTPAGGRIRVALTPLDADGGRAALEVADSGPGIPASQREVVFERFRQLEGGASRRFGGTGLGLSIARDVVEQHRGTIVVAEAPEGGALFRVEVPVRAPSDATVAAEPAALEPATASPPAADVPPPVEDLELEPAPPGAPHALVVEDNPDMRGFVARVLSQDLRVDTASDGVEGLERATAEVPDIIVSDVMMPRMSGDQLVREIRSRPALDGVPILLLTARSDDALRVELLASGAQDWLVKPFHPDELRVRVANLVQLKRAREVLQHALDSRERDVVRLASALTERDRQLDEAVVELRIARGYAERASELKTRFLRIVSHELRTPLNVLGLQLELLKRLGDGRAEHADVLARMRASVDRLADLVDALLHRAQVEGEGVRLQIEDLDLAAVGEEVLEAHRPRAEERGIALELVRDEMPPMRSDPALVRLILTNLLGNAVKFAEGGTVRLHLGWADGFHLLSVADEGPGIPEEDLQRVFEPFEQVERADHKHLPGVGLGLSLVREVVHALGGDVTVTSEAGRGAVFSVCIPEPGLEANPCPPEAPAT